MTAAKEAGAELRARRLALGMGTGLTRAQLAGLLGCSRDVLAHAEAGSRPPPRTFWARADRVLSAGGELLRLYDGAPDPGPLWPAWDEGPLPAPGIGRPARMT
jgi:Helix-turn-helix domain